MTRQISSNAMRGNAFLLCAILTTAAPVAEAFVPAITTPRRSSPLSSMSLLRRGQLPPFSPTATATTREESTSLMRLFGAVNGDKNDEKRTTTTSATLSSSNDSDEMKMINLEFDQALQEGKLREAIRTLRQHPEQVEITRERWSNIFSAIEERTANAEENTENLRRAAEFPMESAARQEMTDLYNLLAKQDQLTLFGAVDCKTNPAAAGSHSVPPDLLEKILDMPMKALTPRPTNTLLLAGSAFLILQLLASVVTGISFNNLALSTLLLVTMDRIFLNGAVFESILKVFSPGISKKILRHEAGHFLLAYLLGCPVEGIVLSAWAALQDRRFGPRQVSAGTSFFDPQLSQQINVSGKVTRSSIDRYSVIVMAGIAAEAEFYGQADGGAGDELALVAFLNNLGNKASSSSGQAWNSDSIRNQARWGALQAVLLLREYKAAYEALVDAMERGGSLGDCIYAIEKAARDNKLKPFKPLGYIVDEDNGQVTWTTEDPTATAVNKEQAIEGAVMVEEEAPRRRFDEEESLEVLKEYREQVEEKLRTIDKKLKEIQD